MMQESRILANSLRSPQSLDLTSTSLQGDISRKKLPLREQRHVRLSIARSLKSSKKKGVLKAAVSLPEGSSPPFRHPNSGFSGLVWGVCELGAQH